MSRHEGDGGLSPDETDEKRQEAGGREQGVRSKKSKDLSSPQFTEETDAAD